MQLKKKHIVLLTVTVGAVILVTACAGRSYCHDPQRQATWLMDKATKELHLDNTQQTKLRRLVDDVTDSRKLMRNQRDQAKQVIMGLLEQPNLPRDKSLDLVENHIRVMQGQAPKLVTAFADFYDSLDPQQRKALREALDKHFDHYHGRHHW